MFTLFPKSSYVASTVTKYYAHSGVLTALFYDANGFHAHLLAGLSQDGKIKNLSFSSCIVKDPFNKKVEDSMFSLSLDEGSRIYVAFNSSSVYYVVNTELAADILQNMQKSICALYTHTRCQQDGNSQANPKTLLGNLADNVVANANVLKASSGTQEAVLKNIPIFVESLTSNFNEELKSLEEKPVTTISPGGPSF